MSTVVILDGEMGKLFGREHRLNIKSPNQALRLINANQGGLIDWINGNAKKFSNYRVICEYFDGRKEEVSEQTYLMRRANVRRIRFTPIITGAGGKAGVLQTVVGVAMIVVGAVISNPYVIQMGISLALAGVSQLLAPKPKKGKSGEDSKTDSHYFSGAENNTDQGQPVPLIYGRIRAGAQAISAAQTVDQLKE